MNTTDTPLFDPATLFAGDGPRTRLTDPITSHEAADSNDTTVAASQKFVSDMLWLHGPAADHELVLFCEKEFTRGGPRWTPQRIRSARSELVGQGVVEFTGFYRLTGSGRRAKVWQVTR